MIIYLTWLLVASSTFVALYYFYIYKELTEEQITYPDSWTKVSVLIPAFNEQKVVDQSLENILNLDYPNYEVIFINDASTDQTLQKAEKHSQNPKLTIIDLKENQGKASALNKGLKQATGELAVVQDADSIIEEDMIKEAAAKMLANPEMGAVIGRILPLNQNSFFRRLQINEYTVTNFYRKLMCSINVLDVTPGAFSIYRTADLKEINGFDKGNLTEDLDVAWRLRKKGRKLGMIYHKTSRTELPKTFSELKGQRVRWARGFLQNARKHVDMFFNSEYGWFGRFQLPLHVLMPGVAVLGFLLILNGLAKALYDFYIQVSAVGFQLTFSQINLWKAFLGFQWKIYIPLAISLAITGYLIKTAYEHSGKKVEHPGALLFYFIGFFAVKAYFWSTAIFKELTRKSKVWT